MKLNIALLLWQILSILPSHSLIHINPSVVRNIRCNETITNTMKSAESHYYQFTMNDTSAVYFGHCYSNHAGFNVLLMDDLGTNISSNYCFDSDFTIPNTERDTYFIVIKPYLINHTGSYTLQIHCAHSSDIRHSTSVISARDDYHCRDFTDRLNDQYIVVSCSPLNSWTDAEQQCERVLGTSLATIITENDMLEAVHTIKKIQITYGSTPQTNVSFWIGLYHDTTWKWIDDHDCYYTETGNCADDVHWDRTEPNILSPSKYGHAAFLFVGEIGNASTLSYFHTQSFEDQAFILCNGPTSQRNTSNCVGKHCWTHRQQFSLPDEDIPDFQEYPLPIAYWNKQLFLIGQNKIHYTTFKIFNNPFEWKRVFFNHNNLTILSGVILHAQFEASLYIFGCYGTHEINFYWNRKFGDSCNILIHIDLNTLYVRYNTITETDIVNHKYCMVAGRNYVYFINEDSILYYQADSKVKRVVNMNPVWARGEYIKCLVTNNEEYIYIFARNTVWKYNTHSRAVEYDHVISSYMAQSVQSPWAQGVTGRNGKLYLPGCYFAAWQTVVFDTSIDQFENATVDIFSPNKEDVASLFVRNSQLRIFDDNVLLNVYLDVIYSTVTETISINFTKTSSTNIWPSDGFPIQYYLNDFRNTINDIYPVFLYTSSTTNNINASIVLNTSDDHCICSEYNCRNCYQHFSLSQYLSPLDSHVNELQFVPNYYYSDDSDILLLPNLITIGLQRCIISLNSRNSMTNYTNPSIEIKYNLSCNCYSRIEQTFVFNITSPLVNISDVVSINVHDNGMIHCQICNTYCKECTDRMFVIHHATKSVTNGKYPLTIRPDSIDLRVMSFMDEFMYNRASHQTQITDWRAVVISLVIIGIMIIVLIISCSVQYSKYMEAFVVHKALVLVIGISQFDDKSWFLPGVQKSVDLVVNIWGKDLYNYDVFVCNPRSLCSTKDDVLDFIDKHITKLSNNAYQCVILHIISHGSDSGDSFICSDGQKIWLDHIRNELDYMSSSLIKIMFNHCCRGDKIYGDTNIELHRAVTRQFDYQKSSISSADSNWATIWGNIKGRALSDSGHFAEWLYDSFKRNLSRWKKKSFRTLVTEIGDSLQHQTNGAEISEINDTLRGYSELRFERCKDEGKGKENSDQWDSVQTNIYIDALIKDYCNKGQRDTLEISKRGMCTPLLNAEQCTNCNIKENEY
eukprot:115879_1